MREGIQLLLGKTITNIDKSHDQFHIETSDGAKYEMYHSQDCCESVYIEDVIGDLKDLIGNPILTAEERTNSEDKNLKRDYDDESFTWTFYELATIKGSVTIRWYGTSNGYYSESVDFHEV